MSNNRRIAKNTLMLYFRMILIMGVTLYTSRVVLEVLGVEDFGIYNVVGGVVAMFNLLVGSLRAATQRFLTFELGKKEGSNFKRIFSASVMVHVAISVIIFLLAEIVGVWFLNTQMNIPAERMTAANWVFQFSILTFIVNLIAVPYNAAIIAHEKMSAFAYISIVEVALSLSIALTLPHIPFDRLIVYGCLLLFVALIIRIIYANYCKRHFSECRFQFSWDKALLREIFSFAGWNFIGAGSSVLMTQGVNIALNIFYGVTVNAARGIATQVQSAVTVLISNFMTALNPQITKSYAAGDNEYLQKLVRQGAKFSYLLMLLIALPIFLETETILSIWLKTVPEYTVGFVRLTIISALIHSLSGTLLTSVLASGNIKWYQIIVGGFRAVSLPFIFFFLKWGYSPTIAYIFEILVEVCCFFLRGLLLRSLIQFHARKFISVVVFRVIVVTIIGAILPMMVILFMESTLSRFIITTLISIISVVISILCFGINSEERQLLLVRIKSKMNSYGSNHK